MAIVVASRRVPRTVLGERFGPTAAIFDVTSRGEDPWVRFSPFYPHGGIPVPFSAGVESMTVEGIWQGLKVFQRADVDQSKFAIATMRGIKRSTRSYGSVLGHRAGVAGDRLLPYVAARHEIYLPSYRWVLEHRLAQLVETLAQLPAERIVILLDYETNCDVDDPSHPLSHAGLVKRYVEGAWTA